MNWRKLDIIVTGALVLALIASVYARDDKAKQSCRLLDTALSEAEMSEAWYIDAGRALKRCGFDDATERAAGKACHARRRGGSTESCQ